MEDLAALSRFPLGHTTSQREADVGGFQMLEFSSAGEIFQ